MPFVENVFEFSDRQACHSYDDAVHNRLVYANGAVWMVGSISGYDPPTDPWQLLRNLIAYQQLHLTVIESQYNTYRRGVAQQAIYQAKGYIVPPPPSDAMDILEREGAVIAAEREKLQAMLTKLSQSPDSIAARVSQEVRDRLQWQRGRPS